jgi:hypothetical protein
VNINLDQDWIDARIFNNTNNITGQVTYRHGIAIGNVLTTSGIYVTQESTTVAQNDSIIIIGNRAKWCAVYTREAGLLANNYFSNDNSSQSWWAANVAALTVGAHNVASTAIFGVYNNTILNVGGLGGTTRMAFATDNTNVSNIRIVNNLIVSLSANGSQNSYALNGYQGIGAPFISHNYFVTNGPPFNYSSYSFNNELNYTNGGSNYGSIDTWGRAASGNTLLIDKGNYLGEYYDINLTRNDIGTYGGPYSIDNYLNTSNSKAGVLYINMPHTLTNINQLINVKASAGSKF